MQAREHISEQTRHRSATPIGPWKIVNACWRDIGQDLASRIICHIAPNEPSHIPLPDRSKNASGLRFHPSGCYGANQIDVMPAPQMKQKVDVKT